MVINLHRARSPIASRSLLCGRRRRRSNGFARYSREAASGGNSRRVYTRLAPSSGARKQHATLAMLAALVELAVHVAPTNRQRQKSAPQPSPALADCCRRAASPAKKEKKCARAR